MQRCVTEISQQREMDENTSDSVTSSFVFPPPFALFVSPISIDPPLSVALSFFKLFSLFLTFTPYSPALRSSPLSSPISSLLSHPSPFRRSQYISLLVHLTPPCLPPIPPVSSFSLHLPLSLSISPSFSLVAACWKLWALMLL